MEKETTPLNNTNDSCLNHFPDPHSSIDTLQEPFLNFDANSEMSFDDKSRLYDSLVALVKAEYPFDDSLQDKAAKFLKSLEPEWGDEDQANQLVTDLVPSSAGSHAGFISSIVILLSSPHSTLKAAALSFIQKTAGISKMRVLWSLLESDLVSNVFAAVQPHTLPISGNERIIECLLRIVNYAAILVSPSYLFVLGVTTAVEQYDRREMIFRKVVIPSSQFLTFLISNRHVLDEELFHSLMYPLNTLLQLSPFHRPTLEFVLASPIAITFSNCLSFFEDDDHIETSLKNINDSHGKWKTEGAEVFQSGKLMMQALFPEGFEDTLEQMMKHDRTGFRGVYAAVHRSRAISTILGSNLVNPDD
ncbi:hypothetical protein BLNAU_14865 [Blattamonas nauphoetae]|uniref:Uncharacterized protein n=1 Tax=Blattamonas nauphoetae TaxID=2049346 RepID=A0ABQ9XER0_9EUKA|nr:hypothetical protein BLNAU_14865 [Blattamonas nauphoetae]